MGLRVGSVRCSQYNIRLEGQNAKNCEGLLSDEQSYNLRIKVSRVFCAGSGIL